MGTHKSFVPIEAIAHIGPDEVLPDRSRADVAAAPIYDRRSLFDGRAYWAGVHGHFGYLPYWMPGAVPPLLPPAVTARTELAHRPGMSGAESVPVFSDA